jgi:hypothetical protein
MTRGKKKGTGSQSGALGRKAPNLRAWWGPVRITRVDGSVEIRPPIREQPMSPLKGRRRLKGKRR